MTLALSNWNQLRIGYNHRAILIGATGCGKTTLARELVNDPGQPFSVVYDAKGLISSPMLQKPRDRWIGHKVYENFDWMVADQKELIEKGRLYECPRVIYRPPVEEERDPIAQDRFFEWIYNRWNCRCYVDEAYALLGGTNPSDNLLACLSRGRERGLSMVIAAQRPSRIPIVTKSEAEHTYIFRLNTRADRDTAAEMIDVHQMAFHPSNLKDFHFYYFNAGVGHASGKLTLNMSAHTNTHTLEGGEYERKRAGRSKATVSA